MTTSYAEALRIAVKTLGDMKTQMNAASEVMKEAVAAINRLWADARRYQWLRDHALFSSRPPQIAIMKAVYADGKFICWEPLENPDEVIDAQLPPQKDAP